jgi:hypothetical protein
MRKEKGAGRVFYWSTSWQDNKPAGRVPPDEERKTRPYGSGEGVPIIYKGDRLAALVA